MRRILVTAVAFVALASPLLAHGLSVTATVDGDALVVDARFSNGRAPSGGSVTVVNDVEEELYGAPLNADGSARLPLDAFDTSTGIRIDVETDDGHEGYRIMMPADLGG